jgi:hypothetical protein
MTQQIALDTGAGVLDPTTGMLWAADNGYELVALTRYLFGNPVISICQPNGSGGVLVPDSSHDWLEELTDEGLGLICNWELAADAPESGASLGNANAATMIACMDALGAPKGAAVYVSNDSIVVNPQAVEDYYAAVASLLIAEGFEPALYGQASLFSTLEQYGYAKVLWKAPDGTAVQPSGTVMVQEPSPQPVVDGVTCDLDFVVALDLGAWNLDGLTYKPAPTGGTDVQFRTLSQGMSGDDVLAAKGALALMGYALGQSHRKDPDGNPLPLLVPADWPETPATNVFDEAMTQCVQRFREQTPGETLGSELGPASLARLLGGTLTV